MNRGERVNARLRPRRLIEQLKRPRKIVVRIPALERRHTRHRRARQYRRRSRSFYFWRILGVRQKGKLAGLGLLHAAHARDAQRGIAM